MEQIVNRIKDYAIEKQTKVPSERLINVVAAFIWTCQKYRELAKILLIEAVKLNNLKLLAKGGQVEIYELDKDKVIRVLRNIEDEEYLEVEMSIMKSLKEKGKAVPKVYEYLKIEGRPSIIIERLNGDTMLAEIRKRSLHLLKQAQKLAELHIELADSAEGLGMISI